MVINYQKFPILEALEQNTWNDKCKIFTIDIESDIIQFIEPMKYIIKYWGNIANNARGNVTFISNPYLECMRRSFHSFRHINLREEITATSGCLILKSDFSNKYVSIVYDISDIDNMMLFVLYECDTIYSFMKGNYSNLKTVVTNSEQARAGREKEEVCCGYLNVLLCYLLMEKYAKVETKTCTSNSKINNSINNKDKKTINYTNLDLKFRDCTWFTTICRNEGFKVRGHFRLQPKKVNGEWVKELIYINEFEKKGYHRVAKIERHETNN